MRIAFLRAVAFAVAAAAYAGEPPWPATERGTPLLQNFFSRDYGAFFQNWCAVQDPRGLVYVGNNSGTLQYDGVRWRLIRTERGTLVRTLALDPQGRVHVGAVGEYGVLVPGPGGRLRFASRLEALDPAERPVADIWSITCVGEDTYVQSLDRLLRFRGDRLVRSWRPTTAFQVAYEARGQLILRELGQGLLRLEGDELRPLPGGEAFATEPLKGVLPWTQASTHTEGLLLVSQGRGLFFWDGRTLEPFHTQADALLRGGQVNHACRLADGSLGIATQQQGFLQIAPDGRWLAQVSRAAGLPSEAVKHVFQDSEQRLWLSLQDGISRVELAAPLTLFDVRAGLPGTLLCLHRHRGSLLAGTEQGLFLLRPGGPGGGTFHPVPGIQGAPWSMLSRDDRLLVATAEGVYEVLGERGRLLWHPQTVAYSLAPSRADPDRVFVGLRDGLAALRWTGGRWVPEGWIGGVRAQVRSLLEDELGRLWVGTAASGVLRLTFPQAPSLRAPQVETFGPAQGLSSQNHTYVHGILGGLRASSHVGIFRFREDLGRFEPDPAFTALFPEGPRWVYALREDPAGRVWMHSYDEERGIQESGAALPQPTGVFRWNPEPCVRFSGNWIETILLDGDGTLWFGGSEGLFRLDSAISGAYERPFRTLVRAVVAGRGRALYEGEPHPEAPEPRLPYGENRLRFEFAAASYALARANTYQTLLEGSESDWSAWTAEPFREFTNLPEGSYRLRVRARNPYGVLGAEDAFAFRILPPWYRTWWAYLAYLLAAGGALRALLRWRLAALRARNAELEARVAERTHDLAARNAELEALDGTVRAINREVALQPLLEAILQQSLRQFPQAETGAVLIQDEGDGLFRVQASVGYPEGIFENVALGLEDILARYTEGTELLGAGVFHVKHLGQAPGSERLRHLPMPHSLLAMSLTFEDKLAGFLVLESFQDPEAFREADAEKLERFREHALTALTKARMFDRLGTATLQLQELNQQKNQFLGIVAHDLRNPLNAIVLSAQLQEGESDPEEIARIARQIQKEGMDMSLLIGRFLDISAIEAGTIKAEPEYLDLAGLARHIVDRHQPRALDKGIQLGVQAPEGAVFAWADLKFLKEVLDNLLSNAIKFSPPGSTVTLRVGQEGSWSRVSVEDQGPGLTAADRKKLFGRFARLSAQPTGGEKSTGLGLSIVKHMVDAMDGRIQVDSEPGQGAAFRVDLPAREPGAEDAPGT